MAPAVEGIADAGALIAAAALTPGVRAADTAAFGSATAAGAGRFRARLAAAILPAAVANEAVRAIGTRALVRDEGASSAAGFPAGGFRDDGGVAAAGLLAGAGAAAGGGDGLRSSSTTGSSSMNSCDTGPAALGAGSTGTAVGFSPSPRNNSGSTKSRPVCSGSRPPEAGPEAGDAVGPASGAIGAVAGSSGSSTCRSGSSSSGGRDAASIRKRI